MSTWDDQLSGLYSDKLPLQQVFREDAENTEKILDKFLLLQHHVSESPNSCPRSGNEKVS
jgi:hypothetical protein